MITTKNQLVKLLEKYSITKPVMIIPGGNVSQILIEGIPQAMSTKLLDQLKAEELAFPSIRFTVDTIKLKEKEAMKRK